PVSTEPPESASGEELSGQLRDVAQRVSQLELERSDAVYARRLRDAISGLAILGTLAAPQEHNELLEQLVRNAAQVTAARVGTLRLLDRATNEVVFEVVQGAQLTDEQLAEVRAYRVPLGQGIAGFVAASGQPVAQANVAQDPRVAEVAARQLGYVPRS